MGVSFLVTLFLSIITLFIGRDTFVRVVVTVRMFIFVIGMNASLRTSIMSG